MNMPARITRSLRLSGWVNDINPVNWKTVLTGWMQFFAIVIVCIGWLVDVVVRLRRGEQPDFHETTLGLLFGFLAGLSGFTLAGRITDRKTDYGYVERVNAGKATAAPQQVNAGDNAQINVANPPQVVTASPPVTPPADATATAQPVSPADDDGGPGLG